MSEANPRDLTGRRFGKWTVIRRATVEEQAVYADHQTLWFCRCDCGSEGLVASASLRKGKSRSCGCGRDVFVKDMAGRRFGRLTVLRQATVEERPPVLRSGAYWICRCDCGREVTVRGYALRAGKTRSCGCLQRELRIEMNKRRA